MIIYHQGLPHRAAVTIHFFIFFLAVSTSSQCGTLATRRERGHALRDYAAACNYLRQYCEHVKRENKLLILFGSAPSHCKS